MSLLLNTNKNFKFQLVERKSLENWLLYDYNLSWSSLQCQKKNWSHFTVLYIGHDSPLYGLYINSYWVWLSSLLPSWSENCVTNKGWQVYTCVSMSYLCYLHKDCPCSVAWLVCVNTLFIYLIFFIRIFFLYEVLITFILILMILPGLPYEIHFDLMIINLSFSPLKDSFNPIYQSVCYVLGNSFIVTPNDSLIICKND